MTALCALGLLYKMLEKSQLGKYYQILLLKICSHFEVL